MKRTDLSTSIAAANLYSFVTAGPPAVLLAVLFGLVHGWERFWAGMDAFFNLLSFLLFFVVGIVVHEAIHGLAWKLLSGKPWSAFKFGVMASSLTPYAHCTEPMGINAYRWGTFMPGLLMGLLPMLTAIYTGDGWLAWFGILFTTAAGGDFLVLVMLREVPANALVEDHPTRVGCFVLEPEK